MKSLNNTLLVLVGLSVVSCNSGGGNSGSGNSLPPSTDVTQVNIDYNAVQQYAVPYSFSKSKSSGYSCIKVVNFISAPDVANSSVIGEFDLVNNCGARQSLSGLEFGYVSLNRELHLRPQHFNLNYISGAHFIPGEEDLTVHATAASRDNYLMVNLSTKASLDAYSQAHFTYSYNSDDALSSYQSLQLSVTGQTPVSNSILNVTLDSNSVTELCHESNSCNMTLHIYGQNSNLFESHQMVSGTTGNILYQFNHINPGQYFVSLSGLPHEVEAVFSNADRPIQINSGESANVTIKLQPTQTQTGSFRVEVVSPDTQVFPVIPLIAHYQNRFSTANFISSDNYNGVINDAPIGPCELELSGIADASTGEYWDYPTTELSIVSDKTVDIGQIKPVKSTRELVNEQLKVVGLDKGDTVTFIFTDRLGDNGFGYRYNRETETIVSPKGIVLANYKFIKGDHVVVNIIINNKKVTNPLLSSLRNPAPAGFVVTEPQTLVFSIPKLPQ